MGKNYVSHDSNRKEVTIKMLKKMMMNTLIVVVATLTSIGFMQTEPSFAEEMRQLKQEARAFSTVGATVGATKVANVMGLVEAQAAPQALQFSFDDSGFDYYDKEVGYVQVGFDASAGALTLELKEAADGMVHSFPEIGRLNPDDHNRIYLERQHAVSWREQRDLLADEQARLRERVNLTQEADSLEIIHQEAYLSAVEDYYLNSLSSLGFSAEPKFKHANTHSYTLQNGAHRASIQFTRMGTDIRVRLQA